MSSSLRDQLMGLGFKPAPKPDKPAAPKGGQRPPQQRHGAGGKGAPPGARGGAPRPRREGGEIDLAKAFALRAQREKDERIEAERQKQEAARLRREAKARLAAYLEGKVLNDAAAEIARHFEYGGKIKRIHVTPEQLRALNAGELGVLQQQGRYLLVTAEVLREAEAIFPDAVALKVDPDAPALDDPYADPQYQVPDDLVW